MSELDSTALFFIRGLFGAPFDRVSDILFHTALDEVVRLDEYYASEQGHIFFEQQIPEGASRDIERCILNPQFSKIGVVGVASKARLNLTIDSILESIPRDVSIDRYYLMLEHSVRPANVPVGAYKRMKKELDVSL